MGEINIVPQIYTRKERKRRGTTLNRYMNKMSTVKAKFLYNFKKCEIILDYCSMNCQLFC
jgi:hypothetical protein